VDERGMSHQLRAAGRRLTPQRQAVLRIVAESAEVLRPADVYVRAQAAGLHLGLTTVYRTLDVLIELGLVQRLHLEDGGQRYAASGQGHRHQLVCSGCGRVVEFTECDLADLPQRLAQRTHFRIEGHWLQFIGLCESCQDSKPTNHKSAT
jgi:Fur family ferric uptake transcriptional regulator